MVKKAFKLFLKESLVKSWDERFAELNKREKLFYWIVVVVIFCIIVFL